MPTQQLQFKNPQGKDPSQLTKWAQDLIQQLRKGLNVNAATDLTGAVPIANGGTSQITAAAARAAAGLNVESATAHGDTNATIAATERFSYTNAAFTAARTWTLPAASSVNGGAPLVVADVQGGVSATNTLSLAPNGTDKIDGSNTTQIALNAAFQLILLWSDGIANWKTSKALPAPAAAAAPAGQCQLTLSGANLLLSPYNGNQLFINGANQTIPGAGVTLAIGAAAASTFYYIYAFMSGGTMTLEFSTTAPTLSNGVKIKTGDATRTLVGAAATTSAPAWADAAGNRLVISWFNRRRKSSTTQFSANRTTTSTSFVEINTEIRCNFISWAEEEVAWSVAASGVFDSSSAAIITSAAGFNGTTPETPQAVGETFAVSSLASSSTAGSKAGLTEATINYATLLGKVAAGTGTWQSTAGLQPNAVALVIAING